MRILFQGDSITDGGRLRAPEKRWDLNHQIGHSYVYPIVSTLGKKFPGKYCFINRGISGNCIDKLAERWQQDTLEEHPDLLSVLIGINGNGNFDGTFPEGVEEHLAHFDATYRKILDLAVTLNPQLKLVIMEPFFLPVGKYREHYADFMKVFVRKQELIRMIAEDYGAVFIPTQKRLVALVERSSTELSAQGWTEDPNKYWLWDGVHPTEAFHGVLADWWLDAVKELL